MQTKCKVPCTGKPILCAIGKASVSFSLLVYLADIYYIQGLSKYGKRYFVGCSNWKKTEKFQHRYLSIPYNVDDDLLQLVMDNNGTLPQSPETSSDKCALTVHPKVGLKACCK